MKNYVKKGLAAVAALAMALVLVPARPAEAKTKKGPRTETKYSIVDGKKVKDYVRKNKYKKGKIVSRVTTYYVNGKKDSVSTSKYTYKKGKLVKERFYTGKKLDGSYVYKYKGKNMVSEAYYEGNSQKYNWKMEYTYKNGKIKTRKEHFVNDEGKENITISNYSYKGNKTFIEAVDEDNNVISKQTVTRTYKKKKLRKEETVRDDGGTTVIQFDSKGNVTKYAYNDEDGKYETSYSYKYKKNRIKQENGTDIYVDKDGKVTDKTKYIIVYKY